MTDDMKTKNRADRSGAVSSIEKETRATKPAFSKTGPPKLELQMGRKWVFLTNNLYGANTNYGRYTLIWLLASTGSY